MPSSRQRLGAILVPFLAAISSGQSVHHEQSSIGSTSAPSQNPAQAHVTTDNQVERFAKENEAIWSALRGPIRQLDLNNLPLDQAIETLLSQTNIRNRQVRWQVLIDQGIARDKPITVKLRDSSVARALELVLDEAGGADIRVGFEPLDGVLTISTDEDLYRRLDVRVYPIGDLISGDLALLRKRLAAAREKPPESPEPAAADAHYRAAIERMKAAESSSIASGDGRDDAGGRESEMIGAMMSLIQETIEPDCWAVNGGTGSIGAFTDSLVVRSHARAHRALSRLLNDLRAAEIANAERKKVGAARP